MDDTIKQLVAAAGIPPLDYDATEIASRRAFMRSFALHDPIVMSGLKKAGDPELIHDVISMAQRLVGEPLYQRLEAAKYEMAENYTLVYEGLNKKYANAPRLGNAATGDDAAGSNSIDLGGERVNVSADEKKAFEALERAFDAKNKEYDSYIRGKVAKQGLPKECGLAVRRTLEGSYDNEVTEQAAEKANRSPDIVDLRKRGRAKEI